MSDVKTIWNSFKAKYDRRIELSCKECKPSFDPDTDSKKTSNKFRCGHKEKGIWVYSRNDDDTGRRPQWIFVREIPKQMREQLCPNHRCEGGSRRCRGAHGEPEHHIWKTLREHGLFLHTFLPDLQYYEKEKTPAVPPTPVTPSKKKRHNKNNRPALGKAQIAAPRENHVNKFNHILKKCGGGRFLFVCESCYNLEPCIVKEMEVGSGKNPVILCKWCNGKNHLLLHESEIKNEHGVRFFEYHVIRPRLSTTFSNGFCRNIPNCVKKETCTWAHSYLELQVWRLESDLETRLGLVRYCNRNSAQNRGTKDGVFHCDRCCISFSDSRRYDKYMKKHHEHFSEICRPENGWIFRPLPQTEKFVLCGDDCSRGDLCPNAHDPLELREWQERLKFSKGRAKFRFEEINESHQFNLQQRPKKIVEETRVQIQTNNKLDPEIKMDVQTLKWKISVASDKMKLLRLGFPNHFEYMIRNAIDEKYAKIIRVQDKEATRHEFYVLFTNPQIYGRHVGDLLLEFENEKTTYYLRFLVDVKGEVPLSFPDSESTVVCGNWTQDKIVVPYPRRLHQLESYEKQVEDMKTKYKIPKNLNGNVNMKTVTSKNYADRMHTLLYREEQERHNVLSRLNMKCEVTFVDKVHSEGYLFASFSIPTSVATDEGLLFKNSCQMVYVGEEGDDCAYESKIKPTDNFEEVTIDVSPECIRNLKIEPGTTRKLQIQFQLDRDTFALRHFALDTIKEKASLVCPSPNQYAMLEHDIIVPPCQDLDDVQNAVSKYLRVEKKQMRRDFGRNENKSYPPLVVAGPFGTGKTHTIKTILLGLLKKGSENATILLCTHSNNSADLYLEDDRFHQWKTKILRLVYHGRERHTVKSVVQQFCLFNGRGFRYPSIDEIRKYRLVVTTFSTALTLTLETGTSGNLFQYIFLDESSQVMEADVIMPLIFADLKKTRIVIAGDHRQTTEKMYSDSHDRVLTILERMYEAYENVSKRCRILLTNNYRCVDGILNLISKLFYKENILQNASKVKCLPGMNPVYFIQLKGQCIQAGNGEYLNESEARQIAWEVQMLIKEREDEGQLLKADEVVVIAASITQVKLIRQILRQEGLRDVSVQTVQGIQGQEYKAVILCTVMRRTNCLEVNGENFGFISDPRLLNTALTRAKSLIVVIGDAVTLCSTGRCEKFWKAFIRECEESGTILPPGINVETVKRDIILAKKKLSISAREFVPMGKRLQEEMAEAAANESDDDDDQGSQDENSGTGESSYDDDDNDSWCSEESVDDLILDDMIKMRFGIDPGKVTVVVGDVGDENIKYGSDGDGEDDDDDPNETHDRPSKSRQGGKAIYPKFTVGHLEQMLRNNGDRYKRCKVKLENWYSARAFPIVEKMEEKGGVAINPERDDSDSIHDFDEESLSSDDAYSLESESAPQKDVQNLQQMHVNPVIFIETRANLGRTFDQDEALVEIIETRVDPTRTNTRKQIGKVLGVLRKRYKNPRYRHFLCTPDEFNSSFMCPIDKKLPKFAILTPKGHHQSARSDIPIYKAIVKDKKWIDFAPVKFEKLDEKRIYVVRYLRWSEYCPYPLGYVEGSFERGDFKKYLKLEHSVPGEYKKALRQKAREIKTPEYDETKVIDVFTIDPDGSMDLDDAISFEKCPVHNNCHLIGIHITDVASVIEEGSGVDKEAYKRFSTFFGGDDGPVHMLPPELGTKTCSLLPGEIKPAISTFFHSCDKNPPSKRNVPVEPQRNFIRSTSRLTYGEAETLIRAEMKNKRLDCEEDVAMSKTLLELWRIMWDWRIARVEGEAYYKNTDSYTDLIDECRAHLLIEEAMISVNANTAAYLCEKDFEIPMRVQDIPDDDEWTEWDKLHSNLIPNSSYLTSLAKYLKRLKRIDEGANESQEDVSEDEDGLFWEEVQSRKRKRKRKKREAAQVLASIDPIDEVRLFKRHWDDMQRSKRENDFELFAFIAACDNLHPSQIDSAERFRSMQKKASFGSQNPFHFSLRLEKYAWSSSPIRRYVDILIQRCIHCALDGQPSTEQTDQAINRICRFYDDRHSQYEQNLTRARVAECLKSSPVILEAAVAMITDAFLKISVPSLGKLLVRYASQLRYGNLMVTGDEKKFIAEAVEEEKQIKTKGQIILTSMQLVWKLRYYNYGVNANKRFDVGDCGKTVKIPVPEWKRFVKIISSPPKISDSEYKKRTHVMELMDAAESLERTVKEGEVDRTDRLTDETRNDPEPIKHKREIKWKVFPGSSMVLQLSGSNSKFRLPEPAIQLLSVADDLEVCVEHMKDPLEIFAPDAEKIRERGPSSMSLVSYRKKWEPLVRMDAANGAVKDVSSMTIQGVKVCWNKVKKNKEFSGDILLNETPKTKQRVVNYFSLQHRFCYDRYIDFHQGDLLCMRLKGVPRNEDDENLKRMYSESSISTCTVVIHGVITRVKKPDEKEKSATKETTVVKVFFELRENNLDEEQRRFVENRESKWTIEVIPLSFSHRSMQACLTIAALKDCSPLVQSICLGNIQPSRVAWSEELKEKIVEKQLKRFKYPLNAEQRKQEQRAIWHDFTIIQGPPGTGKSFLGAQIAAKFAYINKHNGILQKVLYCGPSNKSVDVAAGFLKDTDLKVVRMYSAGLEEKLYPNPLKPRCASLSADDGKMPDANLKVVTLHELIRKDDNRFSSEIREFDRRVRTGQSFKREEMDRYSALVSKAKTIELEKADIIICTCSYSALLDGYENITFGQCIIDECAMCSEPETILPLVKNNPNQVVLIGDHKQLKPVITCAKAERLGLGISLFSRYTEFVGMLTNQYRMHPNIMDFPSRQFYEQKLTCDESVRRRPPPVNIRIQSRCEAVFWNVQGDEKIQHFKTTQEGEHSKYNMKEAYAVIKLLLRLESFQIPQRHIMVLSPYTAQCARIREIIQKKHGELKNVHVGTVVTSQGSEADYVILSTVRSMPESSIMQRPNVQWLRKNLGFLTDPNQINVALTRARQRLFIIGNKNLLGVDALWNKLLHSYEKRRAIIETLNQSQSTFGNKLANA